MKIVKLVFMTIILLALTSCKRDMKISGTELELNKRSMDIYNEALALVDGLKYKEARKLLEDEYETIKDNDKVLNLYGLWEFHIFQNHEKAEELYKKAIKLNPEDPENYLRIGYVYEAKGDYKKAIEYYEKGKKNSAIYENVPLNPILAIAYKNIGNCYLKLDNTEKAILALQKASENNPFSIEVNALLHKLYVESEEYEKAYTVWKNDNLIDESEDHVYKGILEWNRLYKYAVDPKNSTDHVQMANLYEALVLYDEAAIEYEKALDQNSANEDIKNKYEQVKSFLLFRDELQVLLNDYYRDRCINGDLEEQNFYRRIEPAYKKVSWMFPDIKTNPSSTVTWITTLNREIEKKFNVRIKIIKANGSMLGLHFGRIIDSSIIHSNLWEKETDLKVVTLKNMTSNGLDYWRTMNTIGVGGWSENEAEIVRVILNSENDNILQLASLYDKDVRERLTKDFIAKQIEKEEREPLELYFSPEIKMELATRQIDIEIEKARNKGIPENELQRYLFDKIQKNFIVKTNIFVHESQHSTDSKFGFSFKASWEKEYRPKLSQLTYGDMPFSSLNQFYNSSIGEEINNTHLMANTQIFKDIVQYIFDNHEEFPQIDIQNNILAQITKLSEDDLRAIAIEVFERNYPKEKYQL